MKISTALVALLVVVWISFQKASADDAPKRVIPRGAVVDVTGKPVRGARVQIRRWTGVMSEALERATTDEAGRFSFSERDDDVFYVTVQSPGLASVNLHVPDELPMTITLRPAVQSSLTIHDANGQPVAGATISSLSIRTPENPVVYLGRGMESRLDWEFRPSDANGRFEMPPLPEGGLIDVRILHPDWAQGRAENLKVARGELGTVSLPRGVRTTFEFIPEPGAPPLPEQLPITVMHWAESSKSAVSIVRIPFTAEQGRLEFTSHPGEFDTRIQADGYVITPRFGDAGENKAKLKVAEGEASVIRFLVRQTVPCTGRVLLEDGKPAIGAGVSARIENRSADGKPFESSPHTYSDYRDVDATGAFTLSLPRGQCRLTVGKEGFEPDQPNIDFVVEGNGHLVGDIIVRPLPVLKGQVVNESGQAAPGAIVRLREGAMSGLQPTVCDSQGRFEITLPWIPVDQKTSQRIETVKLTAHILNQPYSCISSINLTDRAGLGNLTITLKPDESPDSLLQLSDNAWSNGQRTKASEEAKQNYPAGQSGSLTPELDGGTWLNTDARRLADFRGKYVLLDFWFTGCGPCHADFPSVKLVHEAFADDVVVIAVHDNSSTADKVREHCESLGLKFPIVVDQPDGRVLNKWGSQVGVRWFPTYVLLDPDGRVLVNDAAYVGPSLRQYKLEVIREVVLRQRGTKKTSEASK
ncbi:MAG TPA: carboxypeptidase regulatory-like domain-containing protein [Caulifigura sp.]|nr:carboxypeptidase regulatory-like domain-containing protein [Caulifigura sp.]